ncbi:hypothetical protein DFH28DRAFT_985294 [Melampsora americana]|nr:hypothetical protein DFH28DRAFT_985294 [Melampsora americana]
MIFTLLTYLIGFRLWITGDVAMIGIGYLIICEALSLTWDLSLSILIHQTQSFQDLRLPFGVSRFSTLFRFTRSVYLLFAAMYICKESIEHLVLNHTHVHHPHTQFINQILLSLSILSVGLSWILMPVDIGVGYRRIYTIGFSLVLLLSYLFLNKVQQVSMNQIIGLLEVFSFLSLGLQDSIKIGKVLLQTTPNETEFIKEKNTLKTGLKFIQENETKIKRVMEMKVWKLSEEESESEEGGGKMVTFIKFGILKNSLSSFDLIEILSSVKNALMGISDELSIEFVSI